MNAMTDLSFSTYDNVFSHELSLDTLRDRAPAIFAPAAHKEMSVRYTFIPTERVLRGLMDVGFVPVDARQTPTRRGSALHARHLIRLRRRVETVQLEDSILEILFLNSHDGTSAYQLRAGIFRAVCTNGLIVSRSAFPAQCVAHRGDIVDEVVIGALEMSERFEYLGSQINRMEAWRLSKAEQLEFAAGALAIRYDNAETCGLEPSQLLTCKRREDVGDDLWRITNRVQENLLRGGLARRSPTGRLVRTRRITSIREDIRLNSGLWDLAMRTLPQV